MHGTGSGGRALLGAGLLAAAQVLLLGRTAWDKSDTIDEPVYLRAAVGQWLDRDYRWNYGSPALPKWGFALAVRLADPPLFRALATRRGPAGLYTATGERLRRALFAARAVTLLVTVAGGLAVWSAARRWGEGSGFVAHCLWCLSPSLLATGALATLDAWAAGLAALAVWAALRLYQRPTPVRHLQAGVLLALAGACKVPALGLLPVVLVLGIVAVTRECRREGSRVGPALARAGVAFWLGFVPALWLVYGFAVGHVRVAGLRVGPVPFPLWLDGILFQIRHGSTGHRGYLFGETSDEGWWWYYLAVLAFKITIGAQLLVVLRLWSRGRLGWRRRDLLVDAALLAYPALLLAVMSLGRTQIGIQYLLPAFPCAILWLARGWPDLRAAFGPWGARLGLAALALGALESVAVHPHHLMFFNLWAGGPEGGPRYLVHGCDIGQDQRRLAEWQRRQGVPRDRLFYTPYNGKPEAWGLEYRRADCDPAPGVYALQAIEVHRPKRLPRGCLDWITVEPPDARLGFSIYLYQMDLNRIERTLPRRSSPGVFWRTGRPGEVPGEAAPPASATRDGSVDGPGTEP